MAEKTGYRWNERQQKRQTIGKANECIFVIIYDETAISNSKMLGSFEFEHSMLRE